MYFKVDAEKTIQSLQNYRANVLNAVYTFLNEIADIGISAANVRVSIARQAVVATPVGSKAKDGEEQHLSVDNATKSGIQVFSGSGGHCRIKVNLTGKDVLFVEFSAGITHGTQSGSFPTLPTGKAYGEKYGVGTYNPGSPNAWDPNGWFFRDKKKVAYHSEGNPAYMPMYAAEMDMYHNIQNVAARVFGALGA